MYMYNHVTQSPTQTKTRPQKLLETHMVILRPRLVSNIKSRHTTSTKTRQQYNIYKYIYIYILITIVTYTKC